MKLLSFRKHGERTIRIGGLSVRGGIVDLTSAYASYLLKRGEPNPIPFAHASIPLDMIEFIKGSQTSLKAAEIAIAYVEEGSIIGINSEKLLLSEDEIDFLPPILNPGKIICVGMNYKEHNIETCDPDPYYLKPGDVVEAEREEIGLLINRVVKEEYV